MNNVKLIRRAYNVDINDFCEYINISYQMLLRREREDSFNMKQMQKIVEYFNRIENKWSVETVFFTKLI